MKTFYFEKYSPTFIELVGIVSSTNEVMFSSVLLCLFVCLAVSLCLELLQN